MTAGRIPAAILATAIVGGIAHAQGVAVTPSHGVLNLNSRFMPDPVSIEILTDATIDADDVVSCGGMIAALPSLGLQYEAGSLPLLLSTLSEANSELIVRDPDGNWSCDSGVGAANVEFFRPVSGRYDIWVGSSEGRDGVVALNVSEVSAGIIVDSPKISWLETAVPLRTNPADRFDFICPPARDPSPYLVWGTDIYTDHSSICAAALHTGAITLSGGGVTILELDGLDGIRAYRGTARNGVTSLESADWFFSYRFVNPVD